MTETRWCWIDEEFDALAIDLRRAEPVRVGFVVVLGLIFGADCGWRLAGAWTLTGLASALWAHFAWRTRAALDARRVRLIRLADVIAGSAVWTAMAAIYWLSGNPGSRMMAIVLLMTMLMAAQSYALRSPLAGFLFAAAPVTAFVLLPVGFGGFTGLTWLSVGAFQGLAIVYLAHLALLILSNNRTLRATQDALVRQTESAVAANQSKSAFLAMISHELRTPMTGVLGMAHALTLTDLDPRQASHVDMLVRSGKGLMTILNDILDISKIEAGKLELETIAFDLHEVGQQAHELWGEAASAKGVRLIYDLAPQTPRWVAGDPTRLRQIIANLISNALKFTRDGEVRLSIRPAEGDVCEIAVSDTGPGIAPDQQARLFQAFAQVDAATTRKFGGTGLGLSICKQLAALMGGDISLASREGEGSVFTVRVPLPRADAGPADESEAFDVSLEGLQILVADDNSVNLAVARAILEAFGAAIVTAADGRQALERLQGQPIDVALLDIHMPTMSGLEALAQIRAGEAGPRDQPVIALTADASAGAEADLLAAGFDAAAPKPINPKQLVALVAAAAAQTPERKAALETLAQALA
jgi:signal transduction histidine kinase/AmiR/NasT family two-component response regulator